MEPKDLRYTEDHLWVAATGKEALVGVTDHAQKELADIVFVDVPESGRQLSRGDVFGTIESVKSVSDLVAPLTGRVIEANELLRNKPDTINLDPFDQGWIIRIELEQPGELNELLGYDAYQKHIQG